VPLLDSVGASGLSHAPVGLNELTPEERIALVALIELLAASDARVSEDERAQIGRIATAMGEENYHLAAAEADRRFQGEEDVRSFLVTVGRPAARELIYETALEVAFPEAIDAGESKLLGWLARIWSLNVRFGVEKPRG